MRILPSCLSVDSADAVSRGGIPSVMHTITWIPASTASRMGSLAWAAGMKIKETLAPVFPTACQTVLKTGMPSTVEPHLSWCDSCLPCSCRYSRQASEWNVPFRPVIPWHMTRDSLFTRIAISPLHKKTKGTWPWQPPVVRLRPGTVIISTGKTGFLKQLAAFFPMLVPSIRATIGSATPRAFNALITPRARNIAP